MKVGDIVICLAKGTGDLSSIDKILEIVDDKFLSEYIHIIDINIACELEKSYSIYLDDYIVVLEDYFKEPTKYEDFYVHHEDIKKLWMKFMEIDTVEARKWKLKQLELL